MKNLKELDEQLRGLYLLQKDQEIKLVQDLEQLKQLFSPIQAISETVKQVFAAATEDPKETKQGYSHLWDALTNQIGIKSPVIKGALHLLVDQMLTTLNQKNEPTEVQKEIKQESLAVYHSANHF